MDSSASLPDTSTQLPSYSQSEKRKEAFLLCELVPRPCCSVPALSREIRGKEALTTCFGCHPGHKFLIGIPAVRSDVNVTAVPTESPTLSQNAPQHTASISCGHNFFIYFLYSILYPSPAWARESSPGEWWLRPPPISCPCPASSAMTADQHLSVFNHEPCSSPTPFNYPSSIHANKK